MHYMSTFAGAQVQGWDVVIMSEFLQQKEVMALPLGC
jgi:hypothetical protein